MKLLFKILNGNISIGQTVAFALTNILGAAIIIIGVYTLTGVERMQRNELSPIMDNYIVISKPVSAVSTFKGLTRQKPAKSFSDNDIADLKSIEGVEDVAGFKSSHFPIYGEVSLGGTAIGTYMFLEAVPDRFIDVPLDKWQVKNGVIPIIVPKSYLDFYNFGFAAANDLVQIGESLFSNFRATLKFEGLMKSGSQKCCVVGFTERINTILVPEDVLEELNRTYGDGESVSPTRVIVKADIDGTSDVLEVIKERGYSIDSQTAAHAKLGMILKAALIAVIVIGGCVSLLSFFLLLVSLLLVIEKNKEKNLLLSDLGYSRKSIALPYQITALAADAVSLALAFALSSSVKHILDGLMTRFSDSYVPGSSWIIVLCTLVLFLLSGICHCLAIRINVNKL